MDEVVVAPHMEKLNRAQQGLTRIQQLFFWEYGRVTRGKPLDLTAELAEAGSALARMHAAYTDAVSSLSYDAVVQLAERLAGEWLDDARWPLYHSAEERDKDITRHLREEMHLPAAEEEPSEESDAESQASDALQPPDDEEAAEFWTTQRRKAVLFNIDHTIGRSHAAVLVQKVLGMKKCVELNHSYAEYKKQVAVKDQVPGEYRVGGGCPIKALGDLYANKGGTAALFRAYSALRDGKEDYVEARVAELKKQRNSIGKPVKEWLHLCKVMGVMERLGIKDLLSADSKDRTCVIGATPELADAVNNNREAGRRRPLKTVQGISKALGAELRKVQMTKATKDGVTELRLPQLVAELLCVPSDGTWEKLRQEAKRFWRAVHDDGGRD